MLPLWRADQTQGSFTQEKGQRPPDLESWSLEPLMTVLVSFGFLVGPTIAKFQRFNPIDYF